MRKELLKGLTEEQIAKVKACKNVEEILKVAQKEGIELSKGQLAAVSGGGCVTDNAQICPYCNSWFDVGPSESGDTYYCYACQKAFGQR